MESFRLNPQSKKRSNMLVGLNILSKLQNIKSIIKIGNGIIFLHRCRFHHMVLLWICHGVFISICLISCPPWFYNSYMSSLPRFWYPDYITYRESVIKEPPLMHSDRFDKENRSIQRKKYKVTKQVYRVKKGGRLSKKFRFDTRYGKAEHWWNFSWFHWSNCP